MKNYERKIFVYADWNTLPECRMLGILWVTLSRGKEIFSFEYDKNWLQSKYAKELDADLSLFAGKQYLQDEKINFGMFLDSSPDRWGRVLMKRREALLARKDKREERTLFESDFLLGVYDYQRMGALRFKEEEFGEFLNNDKMFAVPPIAKVKDLEYASLQLENLLHKNNNETLKWLKILINPASSLGGARPKAGVVDKDNSLCIAKFPSNSDTYDVGLWEKIANNLAHSAGIKVAVSEAKKYNSKHHTFITKRFDRISCGARLHFASAMTLLGYTDGTDFTDGASYLELADFIMRKGAYPKRDLEELFRRMVFSICISNTDDHLRNHGFLLTENGWTLSPAYDINPNPTGVGLRLNITDSDNSLNLDLAREVAEYFGLRKRQANDIISKIQTTVKHWQKLAVQYKVSREEQNYMRAAFRV